MDIQEKIAKIFYENIAELLQLDQAQVTAQPELRLRGDLGMESMQYFSLIGALETELDIELQYSEFRSEASSIAAGIEYILKIYNTQQHE